MSATPEGPPLVIDAETTAAFRLLRQATWGPRPGDVEHLKEVGVNAFLDEQLAAPASSYPAILFNLPIEIAQEHFMSLALTEPDQLRQRVAWALHKIWVVSAVEVDSAPAIVTYYRLLMEGAFGNYRDLMRDMTLNPAMGRYLNMLNNRSQQVTGVPPNENYPRELMQLFTLGIPRLNPNGVPVLDANGAPVPAYSENDVKELARILTGWTFGGPRQARPIVPRPGETRPTVPRPEVPLSERMTMTAEMPERMPTEKPESMLTNTSESMQENYRVPMAAVEANHDSGAKTFLGETFPAGQSASQDLEQAMDVLFNHPNIAPFISRQLIQQLVTSNPSPAYVQAIAAVFDNNGSGVRGDLAAIVRAILTHPEASATTATVGQAGRTRALRRVDAARARGERGRSSLHERQGRRDGTEGVLSAVGVQLLLARLQGPRHRAAGRPAARRAGVPDPDVGDQPRAHELRRRRCSAGISVKTSSSTTPRSRRAPGTPPCSWITATWCSWAAACPPRSARKSSRRSGPRRSTTPPNGCARRST